MVVFVVYFSDAAARKNANLLQPLLKLARPIDVPVQNVGYIRKILRQMLYEQQNKPLMHDVSIQHCLSSILLELNRAAEAKSYLSTQETSTERVRRVLESVKLTHYEPHNLSSAARMACLSQRQFTNLCRKITKRSFIEYISEIRLSKARRLIIDTDMPVSAIAFEVGFEDISTFYRAFSKMYEAPPLSLRS
jgi:transcriptional regulator GlxA family with amidase domain